VDRALRRGEGIVSTNAQPLLIGMHVCVDCAGGTTATHTRTLRVHASSSDAKPVQSKVTKREVMSLGAAAAAANLAFADRCAQQPPPQGSGAFPPIECLEGASSKHRLRAGGCGPPGPRRSWCSARPRR
jgi:hypothetical protein